VRPPAVAADAEREHVRVFDEKQQIAHAPGAPILDEGALKRQRVGVRHETQTPHFQWGHA
jgi:hypothetical protein